MLVGAADPGPTEDEADQQFNHDFPPKFVSVSMSTNAHRQKPFADVSSGALREGTTAFGT
jgi:hypothetical protein